LPAAMQHKDLQLCMLLAGIALPVPSHRKGQSSVATIANPRIDSTTPTTCWLSAIQAISLITKQQPVRLLTSLGAAVCNYTSCQRLQGTRWLGDWCEAVIRAGKAGPCRATAVVRIERQLCADYTPLQAYKEPYATSSA
jgi:hypothetical protein